MTPDLAATDDPDADPRVIAADLADLHRTGVAPDGGPIQIGASTWAVYGRTTYDGEVILAEYHDLAEARAVLRADAADRLT